MMGQVILGIGLGMILTTQLLSSWYQDDLVDDGTFHLRGIAYQCEVAE